MTDRAAALEMADRMIANAKMVGPPLRTWIADGILEAKAQEAERTCPKECTLRNCWQKVRARWLRAQIKGD